MGRRPVFVGLFQFFELFPSILSKLNDITQTLLVASGVFGAGGRAWADLKEFSKHPAVKVVALTDLDAGRARKARIFSH